MSPSMSPLVAPWIVAAIAAIIAAICGYFGFRILRRNSLRRLMWHRVTGEVVGYVWDANGSDAKQHWRLRWTGTDGRVRECLTAYGSSAGTLRSVPFTTDLLVDPDNPDRAQPANNMAYNGNLFALVLLVIAAIAVVVAISMVANGLSHLADSPAF